MISFCILRITSNTIDNSSTDKTLQPISAQRPKYKIFYQNFNLRRDPQINFL